MNKIGGILKDMVFDVWSMGKGFVYGFVMISLVIFFGSAIVFLFLKLKNYLF